MPAGHGARRGGVQPHEGAGPERGGRAEGCEPVADALAERELSTPFELYRYPPVRGVISRLGDQDHALVMVSHHVRTRLGCLRSACPVPDAALQG